MGFIGRVGSGQHGCLVLGVRAPCGCRCCRLASPQCPPHQLCLLSVSAFAVECPKIKVGTCKDCIQSGPGCAWCKKPVGPQSLLCSQLTGSGMVILPARLCLWWRGGDCIMGVFHVLRGGWGQEGSDRQDPSTFLSPSIPWRTGLEAGLSCNKPIHFLLL